jgi:hypothetical protein
MRCDTLVSNALFRAHNLLQRIAGMIKGLLLFYLNDKGEERVLLILFTTAITSAVVSQLFRHSCTNEAVQQPSYVRMLVRPYAHQPSYVRTLVRSSALVPSYTAA